MTRTVVVAVLAVVLMFALAAPAFAVNGSGGAGRDFGLHHAEHAQAGHLGADMNPGMHQGFSGFGEHHEH